VAGRRGPGIGGPTGWELTSKPLSTRRFGTFEQRTRAARKGRNPRSGAVLDIAEKKVSWWRARTLIGQHPPVGTPQRAGH
jgi:Bacterial DNA-binding protein